MSTAMDDFNDETFSAAAPPDPSSLPEDVVVDRQAESDDAAQDVGLDDAEAEVEVEAQVQTEDDLLVEQETGDEGADEQDVVVESPYDRPGQWFVVHTYAGYENKVKNNLMSRIASMNMEERIFEVVIPMEDVAEFKNGKRVVVQKKVFPGYLLVRCELDDDSWYVVRNTPGVTGFVGLAPEPTNPVTPGVLRTTRHESSSRSQRTRR